MIPSFAESFFATIPYILNIKLCHFRNIWYHYETIKWSQHKDSLLFPLLCNLFTDVKDSYSWWKEIFLLFWFIYIYIYITKLVTRFLFQKKKKRGACSHYIKEKWREVSWKKNRGKNFPIFQALPLLILRLLIALSL